MKVLSIKQPWAWLICMGIKDVENRTWARKFRGRILIHASATPVKGFENYLSLGEMAALNKFCIEHNITMPEKLPNSAIIGSVEVKDIVTDSNSVWAGEGCYHWLLDKPELFKEPITNVKGKVFLWDYDIK